MFDFLRVISLGKFLPGCSNFPKTLLKGPCFSKWRPQQALKGDLHYTCINDQLRIPLDICHAQMTDI